MCSLYQDLKPKHRTEKKRRGREGKDPRSIHIDTTREWCLNAPAVLTPTKKVLYPQVRRMGGTYIRSKMWWLKETFLLLLINLNRLKHGGNYR